MSRDARELYLDAFRARCGAGRWPGREVLTAPGLYAMLPCPGDPHGRAVVTDDAASGALASLLPRIRAGRITVFTVARRAHAVMADAPDWRPDAAVAMLCRSVDQIPGAALPGELALRPVRRRPEDRGGVPLLTAATTAIDAAGDGSGTPEELAAYLASLPDGVELFAAVDGDGTIRATSGFGLYGDLASVIFVNTARGWRGRGIGGAMTALALLRARTAGATWASLDASDLGLSIYRRLGFETAGAVTRFRRDGAR